MPIFGKSLVLITGASRGIGREVALQTTGQVKEGSVFILSSRDQKKLEEVAEECKLLNPSISTEIFIADMTNFDEKSQSFLNSLLQSKVKENFDDLVLFHNAGTTGDVSKGAAELNDAEDWKKYLDTNLISMIQLNNIILKEVDKKIPRKTIINITSLVAVKGFPSLCQYSVGKAARESYFRVLAAERADLRILSYSPGPVDTDMHDQIAEHSFDAGIRAAFNRNAGSSEVNRMTLTPKQTVSRMFLFLERGTFESGSRIDFFDIED